MTVADLIEFLQSCPSDAEVLILNDCGSWIEPEPEYDSTLNEILF